MRNAEGAGAGMRRTFSMSCRRTVTGAVLAGALAAASLAAAAPARADEVLVFRNRATGRCLDSNWNGEVYTLPCNGGNFQKWRIVQVGSSSVQDFVIINEATGWCLDWGVSTGSCSSDHWAEDWTYTAGNVRWQPGSGFANWREKALDSNADGKVYLSPVNGGAFQFWDH